MFKRDPCDVCFDICYYLQSDIDSLVALVQRNDGPIKYEKHYVGGSHACAAKNASLDGIVHLHGEIDVEMMLEEPHASAHKALEFTPHSEISYPGCHILVDAKRNALRQITNYLLKQELPFYLVAVAENGEETVLYGVNPHTGVTIEQDLEATLLHLGTGE